MIGSPSGPSGASAPAVIERLAWPIWNAEERRMRALVRLGLHGVALALLMGAAGRATDPIARALARPGAPLPIAPVWYGLSLLAAIVATWLCARAIDRRRFTELGLRVRRGYLADVALGAAIGGICMASIAIAEDVLGLASYSARYASGAQLLEALPAIASSLLVFVAVAMMEELVSRGYHLTNLAEGLGRGRARSHRGATIGALAISSAAFGLGHASNPSATWVPIALIAVGGVFLALGYLMQGDLALPIGVHLGWNFFQNLLDMPVSGMTDFRDGAVVVRVETGNDLLTGGAFGPEAGLLGLAAMGLGIALSLGWIKARTGRTRILARFGRPRPFDRVSSDAPPA